ncbi:MAG: preprotein translocase subunit YajC [Christensenella sp.]|uniref:preprotein translocase subunit YajC n=1 Tax=Christensenella sp. TaxID=1935934 RepID=UPI002B210564|nr:preprotein translocase subunit YajC [Christensenella sp.]MEA5003179.1 preprotein translocase subunit YajC [Christensenella sp.]
MGTDVLGGLTGGNAMTLLFPILLIVIFVVLIIVPNKRKEKKFKDMLSTLRVGDNIKTIGGFYGKIVSIKEDLITFECGPDKAKLVISKGAIASVESFEEGKTTEKVEETKKEEAAKTEEPKKDEPKKEGTKKKK